MLGDDSASSPSSEGPPALRNRSGAPPLSCISYTPVIRRKTLCGFADLHLRPWHLRLLGCSCHRQDGSRWVHLPSRALIDKDGHALRDDGGKIRYEAVIQFDDKDTHRRFSDAAVEAIDAYQPGWSA